jgi:hypothetical protein
LSFHFFWLNGVKKIKDKEVDRNRKNTESQLLKVLPEAMYMFHDGLAEKKFGKKFTKTQINATILNFYELSYQGGKLVRYYSTTVLCSTVCLKLSNNHIYGKAPDKLKILLEV